MMNYLFGIKEMLFSVFWFSLVRELYLNFICNFVLLIKVNHSQILFINDHCDSFANIFDQILLPSH
jgi:hypothetical protein